MIYGIRGTSIGREEPPQQVVAAGIITTMIGPTSTGNLVRVIRMGQQQQQLILMVWIFMVQHGRVHRALMVIGAGLPMRNRQSPRLQRRQGTGNLLREDRLGAGLAERQQKHH